MHNTKPRTLGPTAFFLGGEVDWELMWFLWVWSFCFVGRFVFEGVFCNMICRNMFYQVTVGGSYMYRRPQTPTIRHDELCRNIIPGTFKPEDTFMNGIILTTVLSTSLLLFRKFRACMTFFLAQFYLQSVRDCFQKV